jgi:D-alanine-D-alanine ligase
MIKTDLSKHNFGKIGILMGGTSSEREISLKSGKAVYKVLNSEKLDVSIIDITTEDKTKVASIIKNAGISVAFIALHGKFGEDGVLQGILDKLKIPYTGSGARASQRAMDKVESRKIFRKNKIPVPNYKVFNDRKKVESFMENCNFNSSVLVVKPVTHGSSVGVSFAENKSDLAKAVEMAFKLDKRIIIEEFINGREITVGILEDRPLPILEILPKRRFFDFQAKYKKGMTNYEVPAKIKSDIYKKVQEIGLKAHKSLGCCCFSRVDMILKDDIPYVLEVNSIPGLTATSLLPKAAKAVNINFLELCIRIIKYAYGTKKDKDNF